MNMREAVKRQREREENCEKRKRQVQNKVGRKDRQKNKKMGLGNDCSNHRLQVDVLADAAVNLSGCAHMSGHKTLTVYLKKMVPHKGLTCFHIKTQ